MPNFVTDTNGNSRGNFSVDTQFLRLSVDQVASGKASTILAGINNLVSGDYSSVLGGSNNQVTGDHSIAVGNQNLIENNYVILYGNNNEIRRDIVFFGGDNNIFDTSPTAVTSAHIFGLGTNSYGNGDGKFYTLLAARDFSIGSMFIANDTVTADYSVILGGQGADVIYTNQTVRNAGVFPKPAGSYLPWTVTKAQHSSILFDSGRLATPITPTRFPPDILPLINDGKLDPFLGVVGKYIGAKSSSGERRINITVNWIVSEVDSLPNMRMAVGVDHVILYISPLLSTPKVFVNNISKIGDLAPFIFPNYTLNNPSSVFPTVTDTLFSYFRFTVQNTFRAGAQFTILEDNFEKS